MTDNLKTKAQKVIYTPTNFNLSDTLVYKKKKIIPNSLSRTLFNANTGMLTNTIRMENMVLSLTHSLYLYIMDTLV